MWFIMGWSWITKMTNVVINIIIIKTIGVTFATFIAFSPAVVSSLGKISLGLKLKTPLVRWNLHFVWPPGLQFIYFNITTHNPIICDYLFKNKQMWLNDIVWWRAPHVEWSTLANWHGRGFPGGLTTVGRWLVSPTAPRFAHKEVLPTGWWRLPPPPHVEVTQIL